MSCSNTLQFLKFRPDEYKKICQCLNDVFHTSPAELTNLYKDLKSTFRKEDYPPHFVPRSFFQSEDSQFRSTCQESPSIAIDLPSVWELGDKKQDKPTVVILGQDPKSNQDNKQISLGTPYGLHHKDSREIITNTKLYFRMVQVLMQLGYRVYLTDIFKVWVCNPSHKYKGITLPKVDKERFLDILEKELNAVNPAAVVTWGKAAEGAVKPLKISKTIAFLHPSGAANGAFKKLIGKSPTHENKLGYWEETMREELGIAKE